MKKRVKSAENQMIFHIKLSEILFDAIRMKNIYIYFRVFYTSVLKIFLSLEEVLEIRTSNGAWGVLRFRTRSETGGP